MPQLWFGPAIGYVLRAEGHSGGSRASHNLEVTTQRDEGAGLTVLPGPGAGSAAAKAARS